MVVIVGDLRRYARYFRERETVAVMSFGSCSQVEKKESQECVLVNRWIAKDEVRARKFEDAREPQAWQARM
jgi:hypothetical protein